MPEQNNSREYPLNQFAPLYLAGLMTPPPDDVGYQDKFFEYVFDFPNGVLPINDRATRNLDIDQDADFYLTGWYLATSVTPFLIQLVDSFGFELTDGFVLTNSIAFDPTNITPLSPPHLLPKGSRLRITTRELEGIEYSVQLVFTGYKRFERPRG